MKEKQCRLSCIWRAFMVAACVMGSITISVTTAAAQQLYWPAHTPLIDGDDVSGDNFQYACPQGTPSTLYKCQFRGYLYGHWNEGSNTPQTQAQMQHDADGRTFANAIHPMCPPSNPQCTNPKIVVLMIGFSNWTKETCANQPPPASHQVGDINNLPDPNCSNDGHGQTAAWSFINKAKTNADVNSSLVFVDCAEIGAVSFYWQSDNTNPLPPPPIPPQLYTNCNNILQAWPASAGGPLDPSQVQVVLLKNADSGEPGAPNPPLVELPHGVGSFTNCYNTSPYDACILMGYLAQIARNVWHAPPGNTYSVFPNVKQIFVHSRIDAHYANPAVGPPEESPLNPEPYAYESGLAVKWLIQAQTDDVATPGITHTNIPGPLDYNDSEAPWMGWGPYMWASDTRIPCKDCPIPGTALIAHPSLTWVQTVSAHQPPPFSFCGGTQECDFQGVSGLGAQQHPDNTHPSLCGRNKVSDEMMYFFCNSPYAQPWFTASGKGCPHLTQPPQNTCNGFGQGTDTTGD